MYTRLSLWVCSVSVLGLFASLSSADITSGLVGYWKLDDGIGTTAVDSSGRGNHGTLVGSPIWTTSGADVRIGNGSLYFDYTEAGVSDYVDCGDQPDFDITDNITLAFWVKCSAFTVRYQYFFSKDIGQGGYSIIRAAETRNLRVVFNGLGGQYYATGTRDIDDGQWHHIAASYDNATGIVAFYTDGELDVAEAASGDLATNDLSLSIGGRDVRLSSSFMDDVRIYHRTLSADDLRELVSYSGGGATLVGPANRATDVRPDVTLQWEPGEFAATHDVYLGTSLADVNAGAAAVLVSPGQSATSYDAGILDFGETYYWRVDEVNQAPDDTIYKGDVWSFTVEPYAYPVQPVAATASSAAAGMGPEKTIDGSGLNASDEHGTDPDTTWMTAGAPPNWIQYEFDQACQLHDLQVWNFNQVTAVVGFCAKTVTIEHSVDGVTWTKLDPVPEFAKAPGLPGYAANTTVNFGDVVAKYVKLTIDATWGGLPITGLSEVRFSSVPLQAFKEQPADAATDVPLEASLDWRPGREATSHTVYLGTDPEAVAGGTAAARTVNDHGYVPDSLDLATTYYWKVDEVGAATYPGAVWSFTTEDYRVVDDFESYTSEAGEEVFSTWLDGFDNPAQNGAVVGLATAVNGTFCDTATFYEGGQSMPLAYDNTAAPLSETTRAFDTAQDWTQYGITTLVLYFYGDPANAAGQMYLKINGTRVVYSGNASALQSPYWTQWSIDLAATGADLKAVTTLALGVESSGSGLIYVDGIRLYGSAPVLLEAEAGTITPPLKTYDDPLALGGKYIGTDEGIGDENNNPPADGVATYPFTVAGGVYKILLRVSIANASNSFWVRIPDATSYSPGTHPSGWIRFNDIEDGIAWHWDEVHSSDHNNQVVQVTLPAGEHALEIARREDGAKVDAIMILPVGQ
jgi:hypothetical protein